jgi:type IV pilus assembly protein PilA
MIVVAIIGILASIAIPAYQDYIKKSKFTEVVESTAAVKLAVELCAQDINSLTGCDAGANGIPALISNPSTYVATVTTAAGVITATASSGTTGLSGETYILTPTFTPSSPTVIATPVVWASGGTCKPKLCK